MTTPNIKLPMTVAWTPGRIQIWASRHTVTATAGAKSIVTLVYEIRDRSIAFRGVERVCGGGGGGPNSEAGAAVEHLPSSSVSRATWLRIYRADEARRQRLS